jgi:hypothetical protein
MESTTYMVAGQTFELQHHGVKGMKWGVRKKYKRGDTMDANDPSDSKTTRRVKNDYNTMSDAEFTRKYSASKVRYRKRVNRYGDPYMRSPLAKTGKKLAKSKTLNKIANSNVQQKRAEKLTGKLDKDRQKQTAKRGAKAIGKALQVVGTLYSIDVAVTGGAVTKGAAKAGKAAVKSAMNKVGDTLFDYAVLDASGKVIRRYN